MEKRSQSQSGNKDAKSIAAAEIKNTGILYVVATPIGNFGDITERALAVLRDVQIILAEDTRRTKPMLQRFAIGRPKVVAFHEHNEDYASVKMIERLLAGDDIALVSDAGTPLISDPGYGLVAAAHQANIQVVPIPGCCAIITALSVAGLPTDQFFFAGFLPAKTIQRCKSLTSLQEQIGTLVFYESSHRIVSSLKDCLAVLGDRPAVLARELTKMYETVRMGNLSVLLEFVSDDANQQKGEFVLLIEGAEKQEMTIEQKELDRLLLVMMDELPLKQAASLAAKILGMKKNAAYQRALEIK